MEKYKIVILKFFSSDQLSTGLELLKKWNPKQMDDLFVLLRMPTNKLSHLTSKTILESNIVPHGNRVYYFAANFEVFIILYS